MTASSPPESTGSYPLSIVIDAYWWHSGPAALRRTVMSIVEEWAVSYPDDRLVVVIRRGAMRPQVPCNVVVVESPVWPQALNAWLILPIVRRRHRAELILSQNFSPLFGASAVFIHDLMFVEHPEWFGFLERLYFRFMRRMRGNVRLVLTSSQTEVCRISPVLRDRVPVVAVGLGVETFAEVASKPIHGLDREKFLLTVGRLNVRKNLAGAIRAAQLSGRIKPTFPLVVIGNPDGLPPQSADGLSGFVSESVIFLNGIDDNQLKWAYENCAAFVFLSLDEGFGLPPLEAAVLGAPIVVSDIPVFRETLRGTVACSWVSPTDPAAGAEAIRDELDALESDDATARRSENYGTITARYSWAGVVESTRREIQKRV